MRDEGTTAGGPSGASVAALRAALVEQLKRDGFIRTERVEAAFRTVPRHLFVPSVAPEVDYSDTHVVTKEHNGRAISSSSQPAMMAEMLEMLEARPGQRILEIGTGTGYNAALLAELAGGKVVTVDLAAAGYAGVRVVRGDGAAGYAPEAPYDRVMLTVAASDVAPAWYEQLAAGGRLLLPLTILPGLGGQYVIALERVGDHLESVDACRCMFMSLRGPCASEPEAIPPWEGPPVVDLTTDPRRLRVRVYPRDVACTVGPDETLLKRRWTQLVVRR